jgi:trimeric autotransporter adhesin
LTPLTTLAVPGTGYTSIVRGNYTGAPVYQSPGTNIFLNPLAFTTPTSGYGNARRNSIEGPDQFSLSASMNRNFRFHDRYNLSAQIDASNALNHVVYRSYNTTVSPANQQFGAAQSPNTMRKVQLTLRMRF